VRINLIKSSLFYCLLPRSCWVKKPERWFLWAQREGSRSVDHVICLHIKVAILQESLGISGILEERGSVALKKFRLRTCGNPTPVRRERESLQTATRPRVNFTCTPTGIISISANSTTSIATDRRQFFQIFVMHTAFFCFTPFIRLQKVVISPELFESLRGSAFSDSRLWVKLVVYSFFFCCIGGLLLLIFHSHMSLTRSAITGDCCWSLPNQSDATQSESDRSFIPMLYSSRLLKSVGLWIFESWSCQWERKVSIFKNVAYINSV